MGSFTYTVNRKEGQKHYLCTLLLCVRRAKRLDHICRVDGEFCLSFRGACGKKDLSADDEFWKCTLRESIGASFVTLSKMFVVILATCSPLDSVIL